MPAVSVKEDYFVATVGAAATQADTGARAAPASRYRVRIVNTHATDRLYVAFSQAEAERTAPYPEVIEADFGTWDAFVEASVAIWVRPSGTNAINVRIIQHST
jgi:hypothetical protein